MVATNIFLFFLKKKRSLLMAMSGKVAVLLLLLAAANLCWCTGSTAQDERFEEDMLLRPLPDGNILTHVTLRTSTAAVGHYGMFPKVIGEIVDAYGVGEFHVTFSRGQWVGQRWGSPPISAPQGVELWAWFTPSAEGSQQRSASQLQVAWRGLTNALAGLLGASLNLLESDTQYVHPSHSVRPQSGVLRALWSNDHGKVLAPESHVFLGSLPREIACTENLTPWGKLLPCRHRAGLASLLRVCIPCRPLRRVHGAPGSHQLMRNARYVSHVGRRIGHAGDFTRATPCTSASNAKAAYPKAAPAAATRLS